LLAAGPSLVRFWSTVSSPPGSRLEGSLVEAPHATLRIKVHVCKRQEDGSFVLEGRPLDLTRELRERIERMAGAKGP
jgi:hypothetical protein